jgi:putative hemolysin
MEIFGVIFFLLLSAFFSGMEMAYVTVNRLQIEINNQKGFLSGKIWNNFIKNPSEFITTTLVGNNIALVLFSYSLARFIAPIFVPFHLNEALILITETLLSTILILVFGEYIPKAVFFVFANKVLPIMTFPFVFLYGILFIPTTIVKLLTTGILRIFRVRISKQHYQLTSLDLQRLIRENINHNDEDKEIDTDMIENVLYLKELKIRDCMVPRTEISALEISSTIEELKNIVVDTYHSRIIIYRTTIDNVEGYVHHFDLHKNPTNIKSILMPIMVVPETLKVQDLLNIFIKEGKNIAWVVDEFGGTAGIITLEDLLEEIFGEIEDEYDEDDLVDNQLSNNEYILSGRLEIDYINEEYDLKLPEGEYETLSGLIISVHESIPNKNDLINIGKYTFKILDVSDTKIETVKLIVEESE